MVLYDQKLNACNYRKNKILDKIVVDKIITINKRFVVKIRICVILDIMPYIRYHICTFVITMEPILNDKYLFVLL